MLIFIYIFVLISNKLAVYLDSKVQKSVNFGEGGMGYSSIPMFCLVLSKSNIYFITCYYIIKYDVLQTNRNMLASNNIIKKNFHATTNILLIST